MPPTARPIGSSPAGEGARQDRRLFLVLVLIIAVGTAAMALLAYGTA